MDICTMLLCAVVFSIHAIGIEGGVFAAINDRLDNWWELQQEEGPLFDQFRSSKIMMRWIDLDEGKVHTCYEYKVVNERDIITHTDTFCYPSVIVTGYRKSSTSALYSLLSQYPQVKVSVRKENCPFIGDRSIIQYFSTLPRSVEAGDIVLDGCIDLKGNVRMRKLLREPNAFYLVLVRDFASWLWSAYNYWCSTEYDVDCWVGDHWTTPDKHVRTPEAFHDIIMGSINGTAVPSPLWFKKPCDEGRVLFQRYVAKLWSHMPLENTIILASEDLESSPEYVWSRIASAIGMNPQHPKLKAFTEVRYNTQGGDRSTKGADATIAASQYKPGLYSVSKFQPMLESTRTVLNQCWKEDCMWSSLVTGHKFEACHSAEEKKSREFPKQVMVDSALNASVHDSLSRSEAGHNMSVYLRRYFQLQADLSKTEKPFVLMPALQCAANFNHTVALNRYGNSLSMKLKTKTKNDKKRDRSVRGALSTASTSATETVLIVSRMKSHRQFARDLVLYATGTAEYVDVSDEGMAEIQTDSGVSGVAEKGTRGLGYCTEKLSSVLLVGASPKNIRISSDAAAKKQGTKSRLELYSSSTTSELPTNCELTVSSFDKVLYVTEDYLASAWSSYLQSQGIGSQSSGNSGGVTLTGEPLVQFNWTKWELVAVDLMINMTTQPEQTHSRALLGALETTHQLIFKVEDIVFGASKVDLIKRIVGFVDPEGFKSQLTLLERPLSTLTEEGAATRDKLTKNFDCAALLALKRIANRSLITSRTNFNQAYSSEELICNVRRAIPGNPLVMQSLQSNQNNSTCANVAAVATASDENTSANQLVRKCKTRYSQRMYVPTVPRLPPILLASQHSDTVTTRLLIEHSSGAYTGAMVTNGYLTDLFPAEVFCGQRMSAIASNPIDIVLKNTLAGVGTVNLPRFGKNKCMKGGIRGFNQVLLVVRDPFMSVWREFHQQLAAERNASGSSTASGAISSQAHHNQRQHAYPADMKARLLNLTHHFSYLKLEAESLKGSSFEALQENNFEPANALIVSFEAIINAAASPPVVPNTHLHNRTPTNTSRFSVLEEMLHFAQFPNPVPERVECAYKFLDIETTLLELQLMNAYFLAHHHLICEMNKGFATVLTPNRFKFLRLYSDTQCE